MRFWLSLACALLTLASLQVRADPLRQNLAGMSSAQLQALQRRLTDAQCYSGPADGQNSPALKAAVNACPDQRPKLIIETGMHVSLIQRASADRACKLAVTAGIDKTLRLWSLPDGRLLKTLRVPIGDNDFGKLYATALSPDGRYAVVGGWDAKGEVNDSYSAYVFDTASGGFLARLGDYNGAIFNMAFSPDGHWLAISLSGGKGIAVLDTSGADPRRWSEAGRDKGYTAHSLGTAFGPDGRLYTASYDGKLRVYEAGPSFRKIGEMPTRSGKKPYFVAVDPRGERLATGFIDSVGVDIFDAKDLRFIASAETKSFGNGNLASVAWSNTGARLFAGGQFAVGENRVLVSFDRNGRLIGNPQPMGADTILGMQPCGAGVVLGMADPAWGLVDGNGKKLLWKEGVSSSMRAMDDVFGISADGRRVRFALQTFGRDPQLFDLGRASLEEARNMPGDMITAKIDGMPIASWKHFTNPTFSGKPLVLEDYETSRSLAVRNNGTGFVLGTEWYVRNYDAKGVLLWKQANTGASLSVGVTPDNKLVVSAQSDGTIRWRRMSDGAEVLALFVNRQTKAWVAWTPTGYFSASPGGEEMIGWHLNRGWNQAADFFPADRFRAQFARPDVVDRVLGTVDEAEALRQADAARPVKAEASKPIFDNLPPVISILSPADGFVVDGATVTISYIIRSPSGLPVDAVEARVDGRPLPAGRATASADIVRKCLEDTRGQGKAEGALQGCRGTITVDAPAAGAAEIGIAAKTGTRFSEAAILRVTRSAPAVTATTAAATAAVVKPRLYALVVGVADYVHPAYKLQLAAKDAGDFKAALENQKGGLYSDVSIRLLRDREVTAGSIRDGLDWLSRETTSRDVAVLFFAGHGEIDARSNRFYLLPSEADSARLFSTAISREDINAAMEQVAGKAVVFLDACHSGAMANGQKSRGLGAFNVNDVIKDFANADNGLVLFTAATGKQLSLEDTAWGNGAFTKALVEGLGIAGTRAKANMLGQDAITLSELEAYVAERVKQLTQGAQSPVMINPKGVPNFPLALVR